MAEREETRLNVGESEPGHGGAEREETRLNVGESEPGHGKVGGDLDEEERKKLFEVNTAPLKSWPEVVGLSGEDAKKKIETENPELQVHVLPEGSVVTLDYNPKRVRIFVDSNGIVTKTPKIG